MNLRHISLTMLIALVCSSALRSQGSRADYDRAAELAEKTRNKVHRAEVEPHWLEGQAKFWYRVSTGVDTGEFILVDAQQGTRQPAFNHARLAEEFSVKTGKQIDPQRFNFRSIEFDDALTQISFVVDGKSWCCDLTNYELLELTRDAVEASSARVLQSLRASRNGGEETHIRFINKTNAEVQLFWINQSQRRISYGAIKVDEQRDQHTFVGHVWLVTDEDGKPLAVFEATGDQSAAIIDGQATVTIDESDEGRRNGRQSDRSTSPDGIWEAFVKDHNVFLRHSSTGDERPVSHDGTSTDPYLDRFRWSPDATKLVAIQERVGDHREVHLSESAPEDQLQPKLHSFPYAKPGDAMPVARPRLFYVVQSRQVEISDEAELFSNAWRVSEVRWQPDSRRFTFLYNERGHQVLRVVVVDADTGEAAALVEERSSTFIDYAHKKFTRYLDATHELIWMSERDGWNHLYLYDSRTGQVKNQITQGPWVVRGVERIDEDQRRIWFRASGVYPEQDPYYIHYGGIDFDGANLTWLTNGNGTHEIEYSPDGMYFLDRYSRIDSPPTTELRRSSDGALVCHLERADWTELLATGWRVPERFAAKGRDGTTDIHGVIYRPTNFQPAQKYPVIEKIYAGPQGSFVPKQFASYRREQSLAELGFIVVQIDGMGTSHRSKAFHDICWKNLGDAGFPDRILWMKAAAEKYPEMDLSRVGIFGGSAGGQNALRGLLAHGDFYQVGVADCGCHDNRMDKIWWNELWMGWPLGSHYEEQSNVTQAHRLQGKLLLTVGELDRNVDPASTMQVVDALIKADKDFDFLIVPGAGHGVGETPYANRRRQDFFVRHLLGVEPRW